MIGVAVLSCEESTFHAKASKKIKGSKTLFTNIITLFILVTISLSGVQHSVLGIILYSVSSCVSIFVLLWLLYSKNDNKLKSRYASYFLFFLSLTNLFFLTNNIILLIYFKQLEVNSFKK